MKYTLLISLLLVLVSCDYFDVKKTTSEAILKEELKTFNWTEVDAFPTFSVCDSVTIKTEKEACFKSTFITNITDYLLAQNLVVTHEVSDTLHVDFNISDTGEASVIAIKVKDETVAQLPQIKELIIKSTQTLPQIFPALKRGQQVTTQFKLPVIIKVN